MTTDPAISEPHPRRTSLLPTSPADWIIIVLALGLFAYGVWRVIDRGGSLIGFGAMALAFVILPYRVAGLIGGLGIIAVGVRECVILSSVTLLGGVLIVIGILTIAEKLRRD